MCLAEDYVVSQWICICREQRVYLLKYWDRSHFGFHWIGTIELIKGASFQGYNSAHVWLGIKITEQLKNNTPA